MEAGRARNRDDNPGLPTLSLGLSSVRHIVTKLEAEYARVVTTNVFKSEIVKYNPCSEENNDYYDYPFDPKEHLLNRFVVNLGVAFSKCIPSVTIANFGFLAVTTGLFAPRMISYLVVYPFCRLVFGTLYPAYASYKAVRTKNLKEYVKWMMYWIVFALFTCTETFTDVFLSWFPFYYEVKIVLVLWLLSPATKGSSILYRKFVHPALCRREQEIDEYIAKAKDQGYHTVLNLGTKGVNYATTVIMQTAIKGGGGLVQQLRKSYSLSDLSECEPREERAHDEADDVLAEPRLIRRVVKSGYATRRSASESNSRTPMYFPEVDVDVRPARNRMDEPDFSHIKSTEDISSGYSSAENSTSLTRTSSVGGASRRARASRSAVTTIKRPPAAEDNQVIIEELHDGDSLDYANTNPYVDYSPLFLSHTDPPFIYQYIGDQVKILKVLGNYPLNDKSNRQNDDTDKRDQYEGHVDIHTSVAHDKEYNETTKEANVYKDFIDIPFDIKIKDNNIDIIQKCKVVELIDDVQDNSDRLEHSPVHIGSSNISTDNVSDTLMDVTFFDTSPNESDDEASYITPVSTPVAGRKIIKGKYGKNKAPLPPIKAYKSEESLIDANKQNINVEDSLINDLPINLLETNLNNNGKINAKEKVEEIETVESIDKRNLTATEFSDDDLNIITADQNLQVNESIESTVDNNEILNIAPDLNMTVKENIDFVSDKETNRKSISPVTNTKGSTALGKLLQLPGKLAFWHKTDDKSITNSTDTSRRSSTENVIEDSQNCSNLNVPKNVIPQIEKTNKFKDIDDVQEKSDALQKIINAKLENHPEYKLVSLHEELPTTSKSTDV